MIKTRAEILKRTAWTPGADSFWLARMTTCPYCRGTGGRCLKCGNSATPGWIAVDETRSSSDAQTSANRIQCPAEDDEVDRSYDEYFNQT